MTITHREFFRLLPKFTGDIHYSKSGNEVQFDKGPVNITVILSDETVRKLGSFSLPVTTIRMELIGREESELLQCVSDFDLTYRKLGG